MQCASSTASSATLARLRRSSVSAAPAARARRRETQFAARDPIEHRAIFGRRRCGVERRRRNAVAAQLRHLIAHQRDQRRHHDGEAVAQQRRKLVAQRLAAAGRHHRQHVAAVEDGGDDLGLPGPEGLEAEGGAKRALCRREVGHDCPNGLSRHSVLSLFQAASKRKTAMRRFLAPSRCLMQVARRTIALPMPPAGTSTAGASVGRLIKLLCVLWLAGVAMRMTILAMPPVIPLVHDELHMSETQVGLLIGLPLAVFAIAAVPGSLLIARIGAYRAVITGMVIAALAGAARGAAVAWDALRRGDRYRLRHRHHAAGMPTLVREWLPRASRSAPSPIPRHADGRELCAGSDDPVCVAVGRRQSWRLDLAFWGAARPS
jgi:hypothetical protein